MWTTWERDRETHWLFSSVYLTGLLISPAGSLPTTCSSVYIFPHGYFPKTVHCCKIKFLLRNTDVILLTCVSASWGAGWTCRKHCSHPCSFPCSCRKTCINTYIFYKMLQNANAAFGAPLGQSMKQETSASIVISSMALGYVCTLWNKQKIINMIIGNYCAFTFCVFVCKACKCMCKFIIVFVCKQETNVFPKDSTYLPSDSWSRVFLTMAVTSQQ